MSDLTPISVRLSFHPYDPDRVRGLLRDVARDFGPPGRATRRWWFTVPTEADSIDPTGWIVDFFFRDKNDALMFGLKYQSR